MTHNKSVLELGWCTVHFEVTDMISNEVFVWAENIRKPTREELKAASQLIDKMDTDFYLYTNVDASNPVNMRFAQHFGFTEVRQSNGISVQVWDKNRCKQSFFH